MKIQFHKYSATGNDFVLIDDRNLSFPTDNIKLIKKICGRKIGVGADGVILLQPSETSDFQMRHFNPDGSEAEMCGNGARSIIRFAKSLGIIKEKARFQSMLDSHEGMISDEWIKIKMNPVRNMDLKRQVKLPADLENGGYLEIGVPHFIVFTNKINEVDVNKIGREISHNPVFIKGTNVNFVQIISGNRIHIRTFERGVEEETLSCGTGATASAILAYKLKKVRPPVMVAVPGGELIIDFETNYENIWLSGPAEEVYQGWLTID